ncbi:uroporphyrinogen-III C-methyltransferase [Bacillus licheniformis]|uniref:uroporphyrinogen-III C-methyltransferase n=1 Tax=Bacillus licheniformis TaxID=1402 RepID=UPI0009278CD4|nr:uroporphyrinogen-III C-methyltransferase [Bacillus licheniformis]MCY7774180.1 uroporphyrinogen-III C-methyltransferase [Bacillus licheniformis]MCY7957090.1 uroporphyrinogen-III C-methyltransferase [Bacillus licheniformis]MCY8158412.1 uroporphyrinogen-III C-methyltransferase [Bacillus licheniformis]MCY8530917.1 uroporphyrinogen-III C-methyltransferase [Bacillus licheniformis]MCY8745387.1 uroporphyrinogen-III C-methyltransferase [Bacillus licheniformis]
MGNGKVYFVGAGPGDSGLITLKGRTLIEAADVILYDRLVNSRLLEHAKASCEFVYCGKLPDRHYMRQSEINALLIEKGLKGLKVVRLKGGDPSVFGRVGEEAAAVSEHGIPYEMVPGITSGIAAPLYAGLPVTHRDFASSFAVVTAHDKSGKPEMNWEGLANGVQTLVFYMGIKNLGYICEQLMKHGKSPLVPAMVIQWGTWGRQRSVKGTLQNIREKITEHQIKNPAIIVIGDIVSFRQNSWFEEKPLIGLNIMAVKSCEEEQIPVEALREQGAEVVEWPKWKSAETVPDDALLGRIACFDSLLFTSSASLRRFFSRLAALKIDVREMRGRLYASDQHVKAALEERGFEAFLQTEMPVSGSCLLIGSREAVQNYPHSGCEVLITHDRVIDSRFTSIIKREIDEFPIDIVLFSNRTCVELFVNEAETVGLHPEKTAARLQAFCLTEEAGERAAAVGFQRVHAVNDRDRLPDVIKEIDRTAEFVCQS